MDPEFSHTSKPRAHFSDGAGTHVFIFSRDVIVISPGWIKKTTMHAVVAPRICFACGSKNVSGKRMFTVDHKEPSPPEWTVYACDDHRRMGGYDAKKYISIEGFTSFVVVTAFKGVPEAWIGAFASENHALLLDAAVTPATSQNQFLSLAHQQQHWTNVFVGLVMLWLASLGIAGLLALTGLDSTIVFLLLEAMCLGMVVIGISYTTYEYFVLPARRLSLYKSLIQA